MKTPRSPVRFACWMLLAIGSCVPILRADETLRQVQEELRRRNLYFGDIDGCKTAQVSAALRSYQKRKGFNPTGEPDDTTLRSLNLLPALPLIAGNTAPAPAPSGPTPAPWPDITVLRSDAARRVLPRATPDVGPEPAATPLTLPTPGPPPSAASVSRPDFDTVRSFIADYLKAGQANDTEAELAFYGDHVDYFNEGVVDRHFIRGDVTRYDHRWPRRQFTLLDPVTLSDPSDGNPDKVVVHFRYAFVNKGSRYTVEGKADNAFTLVRTGPDSLRIVSMKEQRVRDK